MAPTYLALFFTFRFHNPILTVPSSRALSDFNLHVLFSCYLKILHPLQTWFLAATISSTSCLLSSRVRSDPFLSTRYGRVGASGCEWVRVGARECERVGVCVDCAGLSQFFFENQRNATCFCRQAAFWPMLKSFCELTYGDDEAVSMMKKFKAVCSSSHHLCKCVSECVCVCESLSLSLHVEEGKLPSALAC